jgi:hypothetical protein
VKICVICGKIKFNTIYLDTKKVSKIKINMTKKNILIALITFILAFGTTFYVIRTYFPKQKTEKTAIQKDKTTQP